MKINFSLEICLFQSSCLNSVFNLTNDLVPCPHSTPHPPVWRLWVKIVCSRFFLFLKLANKIKRQWLPSVGVVTRAGGLRLLVIVLPVPLTLVHFTVVPGQLNGKDNYRDEEQQAPANAEPKCILWKITKYWYQRNSFTSLSKIARITYSFF